jgi:hypothetical protein
VSRHHRWRIHLGGPNVIGDSESDQTCVTTQVCLRRWRADDTPARTEPSLSPTTTPVDSPRAFVGGIIREVTVDVAREPWVDLEQVVVAAFARE